MTGLSEGDNEGLAVVGSADVGDALVGEGV